MKDRAHLEQWLERIAAGDPVALNALYQETKGAVYGYALSILKNSHDAEDVLQDCYLTIVKSAAGYRAMGKPMAWILTLTRNLCLRQLREKSKSTDLPPEEWSLLPELPADTSAEDRLLLEACLKQLTEEEREIVLLHAVSGFKHREIASFLAIPLPTVLSKYHRAIKKMQAFTRKESEI